MKLSSWTQLRLPLLAFNLLTTGFVLGKSLIDPQVGQMASFEFEENVPLSQWQSVETKRLKPLPEPDTEGSILKVGRFYQYRQDDRVLDVKMRYVVRTRGEVQKFIQDQLKKDKEESNTDKKNEKKLQVKEGYEPDVGHYILLSDTDRAYLSSCINPRGETTFSQDQYKHNQDIYDTEFSRIFPALLGREKWRDDRCLWTYMSMPLNGSTPEEAYKVLEAAWWDWHEWWQPNFPKL
ncbi:MAG TPA: cyanoexosortase A system-associated protein [Oscillatoriales cyanobacterium M59_W2019_021]|nr:cyanoexosortase A system-associated protein [Oscillatoriales cyanobacterium M59_W2019_021]